MTTEPFREDLRYEYPLTPDSVVLDCGGYEGTFAEEISRRHDCHVHVLEPVRAFYEQCRERLKDKPKVRVYPFGIGLNTRMERFHIKGSMTGMFVGEGESEDALLIRAVDLGKALARQEGGMIDLLKLNCEGMEYEVLESLISHGELWRYRNIQVQFHGVAPRSQERYDELMVLMTKHHELTFDYGWVWQNWRIKE